MKNLIKGRFGPSVLVASAVFGAVVAAPSSAAPILVFSQQGLSTPVTAVASGNSTTLSARDVAITISGIDAPFSTVPTAYFSFTTTSNNAAQIGADGNLRQNFDGSFTITSETGGLGTNYLSGTFKDLFEAINSSATLIASTPAADAVTFTSSVIPLTDLMAERAVSFSFTGVTPAVVTGGFNPATTPSFQSSISGNFSAGSTAAVPEPASWAMFIVGFGFIGAAARRKRPVVSFT